ncbi:lipocalin family protein [Zeaxanthinibacter enoshimensis]|uniref:lipocalin family protein n=1 Tax=Zeaxanthinibacter enoshimensis TaxID=392009 RepID=UPI003568E9D7
MNRQLALLTLLLTCILFSCARDEESYLSPDIVGIWQLRAVLADPGDGSGEYEPVRSDKTIEFFADGTFITNVSFCDGSRDAEEGFSGTYNMETGVLSPEGCVYAGYMPSYSFVGKNLVIQLPCIEPCGEKYEKIK